MNTAFQSLDASDALNRKTRTETPIPLHIPDKDEAMSEGDESDTEDLSEGTSSDDNWSDSSKLSSSEGCIFLRLLFYLKIPSSLGVLHRP